jgi:predicted small secreted protein
MEKRIWEMSVRKGVMMKRLLVLACLLSLLVPALLLAGCGSESGGEDTRSNGSASPEDVAQAFWEASLSGDADTSWSLLSEQLQTGLETKEAWASSGVSDTLGGGTVETEEATITGDEAEVTIRIMNDGEEITSSDVLLIKEGDEWKIKIP